MSERPVVDFDHHAPEFAQKWIETWNEMRDECPVAWSENHNGYWVLSRYKEVAEVSHDDVTFSSYNDVEGGGANGGGCLIPQGPVRMGLLETDPPLNLRRLVTPWFTPPVLEKLRPWLKDYVTATFDRVIEQGECDLIFDIVSRVTAAATMHMLGLDINDAPRYGDAFHRYLYTGPDHPEFNYMMAEMMWVQTELCTAILDRQENPRDDRITELLNAKIDGEPLDEQTILEILLTFLGGGLDTTTSLTICALVWLDEHPEEKERLRQNPDLLQPACEEFLRYFSPIQALARTVKAETTVGDQTFLPGERVLIGWAGANHDPEEFDRADEVVLDRFPNHHAAFGLGAHRCLGSNLARVQFQAMMREILARMPDYTVDRERLQRYPSIGLANGFISVPATFSPGPRVGTKEF